MSSLRTIHYETFALDDDQAENLQSALDRAREIAGVYSLPKSALLSLVCDDFLSTNSFGFANDPNALQTYIQKLEAITGKKLVIIDPQTREVTYGMGHLQYAAGETDG